MREGLTEVGHGYRACPREHSDRFRVDGKFRYVHRMLSWTHHLLTGVLVPAWHVRKSDQPEGVELFPLMTKGNSYASLILSSLTEGVSQVT